MQYNLNFGGYYIVLQHDRWYVKEEGSGKVVASFSTYEEASNMEVDLKQKDKKGNNIDH